MTKQDFITKLAEQEGIEKKQAAAYADAVIKALTEALLPAKRCSS